jgi:predicted transcriptional regulator
MPGIDLGNLLPAMLKAAEGSLGTSWGAVRDYAKMEFTKIVQTIADIDQMKRDGKITLEEAQSLLDMQKHATRAVMLAVETMGVVAVEKAINAALGAVRDVVNKAVGWSLL